MRYLVRFINLCTKFTLRWWTPPLKIVRDQKTISLASHPLTAEIFAANTQARRPSASCPQWQNPNQTRMECVPGLTYIHELPERCSSFGPLPILQPFSARHSHCSPAKQASQHRHSLTQLVLALLFCGMACKEELQRDCDRAPQVCYILANISKGMGSLKRGRAAQQWQRFRQGSISGDAGGPYTVLIMPDGDEDSEIVSGMFEQFEEFAKPGDILRVKVLFPCISVVLQDATSDK